MTKRQKPKRRHHFLAASYLRGFSETPEKQLAEVYVVDLVAGEAGRKRVTKIAWERDFNRIEVEGRAIDELEDVYAELEAPVSQAIRRTEENKSFASEDDRYSILQFIAILFVRNPRRRKFYTKAMERSYKIALDGIASTPEKWESHLRKMFPDSPPAIEYAEVRRFIDQDKFRLQVEPWGFPQMEIPAIENVTASLLSRSWTINFVGHDVGEFVTSDHPVILDWDPVLVPDPFFIPPGFANRRSMMMFPLNRHMTMIGRYVDVNDTEEVDFGFVSRANSCIISNARRQVYASSESFSYVGPDETYRGGETLHLDPDFRIDEFSLHEGTR